MRILPYDPFRVVRRAVDHDNELDLASIALGEIRQVGVQHAPNAELFVVCRNDDRKPHGRILPHPQTAQQWENQREEIKDQRPKGRDQKSRDDSCLRE